MTQAMKPKQQDGASLLQVLDLGRHTDQTSITGVMAAVQTRAREQYRCHGSSTDRTQPRCCGNVCLMMTCCVCSTLHAIQLCLCCCVCVQMCLSKSYIQAGCICPAMARGSVVHLSNFCCQPTWYVQLLLCQSASCLQLRLSNGPCLQLLWLCVTAAVCLYSSYCCSSSCASAARVYLYTLHILCLSIC
jgi:hypothetical protein